MTESEENARLKEENELLRLENDSLQAMCASYMRLSRNLLDRMAGDEAHKINPVKITDRCTSGLDSESALNRIVFMIRRENEQKRSNALVGEMKGERPHDS